MASIVVISSLYGSITFIGEDPNDRLQVSGMTSSPYRLPLPFDVREAECSEGTDAEWSLAGPESPYLITSLAKLLEPLRHLIETAEAERDADGPFDAEIWPDTAKALIALRPYLGDKQ
ncbi:hypothetical protein D9M68_814690 [compost metagenome]